MPVFEFTPQQARTIVGIPTETLRHWRRAIPYLAKKTGKAARFSATDLIGLAITRELIAKFGASITSLHAGVDVLFRKLTSTQLSALQDCVVVIDPSDARIGAPTELLQANIVMPVFVVPCGPLVLDMKEHLLPGVRFHPQAVIHFNSVKVRRGQV